jgi:hypothetical protein
MPNNPQIWWPWRRTVCLIPPYPEAAGGAPRSAGRLLRAAHTRHRTTRG